MRSTRKCFLLFPIELRCYSWYLQETVLSVHREVSRGPAPVGDVIDPLQTFLSQWSVTTPNLADHRRKVHRCIQPFHLWCNLVQGIRVAEWWGIGRELGEKWNFKKNCGRLRLTQNHFFRNFPSKMECFGTSGWRFKEGIHITYHIHCAWKQGSSFCLNSAGS